MKVSIIINPIAGRGNGKRLLSEIRSRFVYVDESDILITRASGDEETLALLAIEKGCTTLVVVGGDGTCSRVARAIAKRGSPCRLAVVPAGTGNDFAKTLGVDAFSPEQVAALVAHDRSAPIDMGLADGEYFVNSCGFGFDASVLEATQGVPLLKGNAVYIYAALTQLLTYRGASVSVDSELPASALKMLMVTVSNGRFLGGAFCIAPDASVVDGQLDFGFVANCNLIDRIRIFAGALRGTHLTHRSVRTKRARAMTLHFASPPMMEIDGELKRARSPAVSIECLPRALSVIAAPGFPR